jgi:hypothetical protein
LVKDLDPVSQSDEKYQVHKKPAEPGEESSEPYKMEVGNRPVPTDCGHRSFIKIFERLSRPASRKLKNVAGGGRAHLHRGRRDTWHRLPRLMRKIDHITNRENLGMAWNTKIRLHQHAPLFVGFNTE